MTATSRDLRRSFELHGVGVEILAESPTVIDAIELRFRSFPTADPGAGDVRFEFIGGREPLAPIAGRAVYDTQHGSLLYDPARDVLSGQFGGVALRCEPGSGVAVLQCPEFSGRDLYLATHPLLTVSLMELMERRGRFSLHAACLCGHDGAGVLLAGPSGSGKSTLTLALARAGLGFVSDDIVFLARAPDGGPVRALGFADALGLTDWTAEQLHDLRAPAADGFPKRLERIEDLFGLPTVPACLPRALVFPEVAPEAPSAIAPLDPREALLRLVPDVLLTDRDSTQAHLAALAALLDQVSCHALRSGSDLARAGELVAALL